MIPSCFTLTFSLDCLLFNNKQTNTKDKQLANYFIIIFIYFIPENPLDQTSHENRLCPMIKKNKQTRIKLEWELYGIGKKSATSKRKIIGCMRNITDWISKLFTYITTNKHVQ